MGDQGEEQKMETESQACDGDCAECGDADAAGRRNSMCGRKRRREDGDTGV